MKVIVIGSGGREHALARALHHSPSVSEVHVFPGNSGMASDAICHDWDGKDFQRISDFATQAGVELIVVGPEAYLADGLANFLRSQSLLVVGPNQAEAQLESSKIFAKEFMKKAGVPTSKYQIVASVEETSKAALEFDPPYVLKADGLAAGKGVFICENKSELEQASRSLFIDRAMGAAGEQAMLEQFMPGWELSYHILTNGQDFRALPLSQDHKRLLDSDKGPNTGGMGTVAPLSIDPELDAQIKSRILKPIISEMVKQEMDFRGILFIGMMMTKEGPSVLEFNVRFGDPEAQVILPLLDGDWGEAFLSLAKGQLPDLMWKSLYTSCVVLAAENYPSSPVKGAEIKGDLNFETASSYFLHAGTKKSEAGRWVTNGGRVMAAIGIGSSLKEALKNGYQQARQIRWDGLQMRTDIGAKILNSNANELGG